MPRSVALEIPAGVLHAAHMSPDDIRLELAMSLYAQGRLSLGMARSLTHLSLWDFRHQLAARGTPVHYSVDDLDDDVQSLQALGLL